MWKEQGEGGRGGKERGIRRGRGRGPSCHSSLISIKAEDFSVLTLPFSFNSI